MKILNAIGGGYVLVTGTWSLSDLLPKPENTIQTITSLLVGISILAMNLQRMHYTRKRNRKP